MKIYIQCIAVWVFAEQHILFWYVSLSVLILFFKSICICTESKPVELFHGLLLTRGHQQADCGLDLDPQAILYRPGPTAKTEGYDLGSVAEEMHRPTRWELSRPTWYQSANQLNAFQVVNTDSTVQTEWVRYTWKDSRQKWCKKKKYRWLQWVMLKKDTGDTKKGKKE